MSSELQKKEIMEAIHAGESALASLRQADEYLNSAKNWGIYDMLGGGFFGTMIKHSKMNHASACLEDAKRQLKVFQRELKDVSVSLDLNLNVGEFLSFADYFFDGLIADYMVQSRIAEARGQTADAISHISRLLADLNNMYRIY